MRPAMLVASVVLVGAASANATPVTVLAWGSPSGNCSVGAPLLVRPPPGLGVALTETGFSVVRAGPRTLLAPQALSSPQLALAALDAGAPPPTPVKVVLTDSWFSFAAPGAFPVDVAGAQLAAHVAQTSEPARLVDGVLRQHALDGGLVLDLEVPALGGEGLELQPVQALDLTFGAARTQLYTVCRIRGEWSRQAGLLAAARPSSQLVVALGNVLAAPVDPDRVKASTIDFVERLRPDALVPGRAELVLGAAGLTALGERVPLVAANLVGDGGVPLLPTARVVHVGDVAIGLVGLVGDRAFGVLPAEAARGMSLIPTSGALFAALESLRTRLGREPDVVLLLADVAEFSEPKALDRFGAAPVDLVLGTLTALSASRVELARVGDAGTRRPLSILAMSDEGPTVLTLDVSAGRGVGALQRVTAELRVADETTLPEPRVQRELFDAEVGEASALGDVLLPPPDEVFGADDELRALGRRDVVARAANGLGAAWSPSGVRRLLAALAREAATAEVGVVRELPVHFTVGGRVSAAVLAQATSAADRVRTVTLTGAELELLARALPDGVPLTFSGYEPAKRLVGGRAAQPTQRYRVALPDVLWGDKAVAPLLDGKPSLDGVRYAELLVPRLRALRDALGGLGPSYTAALRQRLRAASEPEPLWTFGVEQLQVTYLFNVAANNAGYLRFQEQRVQSPTFHLLSAKGALAATYDARRWTFRAAVAARFNRLFFPDFDRTLPLAQRELEDSLRPEAELRFKALTLQPEGAAGVDVTPYVKTSFDTEFTAVETGTAAAGDVAKLPQRAFLNGAAGVGLFPGFALKEVRAGFVTQGNLSKPAGRKVQFGMEALVRFALPLPKGFTWRGEAGATYFPPAGEVVGLDDDVLGVRLVASTGLAFALFSWLSAGISVDYLGFQGKTPATGVFAHNLQLGLTLTVDRTFKPRFEGP